MFFYYYLKLDSWMPTFLLVGIQVSNMSWLQISNCCLKLDVYVSTFPCLESTWIKLEYLSFSQNPWFNSTRFVYLPTRS